MAKLKCVVFLGQSNKEGMAPWDEMTDANFLRLVGVPKPGSFENFDQVIPGYKVWTSRMPRAGTAITATAGTPTSLTYTTGPAVGLNEFANKWVVRTGGGAPGIARFCASNNAAGGGGAVSLIFDTAWDVAPTTETFNITQGGTQGAAWDYATNPAATFQYEGEFRDLLVHYDTPATMLYTTGWDYTNLHGLPLVRPALALSFRFAGSMFEHIYQLKQEIPAGEDLYVICMPLPYSFLSVRIGALTAIANLDWSWLRSERTNDWNIHSADPAGLHARYDLYHLLVEHIIKGDAVTWLAANQPDDELEIISVSIALGESESSSYWLAEAAGANMTELRDAIRGDIAAAGLTSLPAYRLPFILNGMDTDATAYPGGTIVNPQYEALAAADPNSHYVYVDDMVARGIDPLHFNAESYITIGQREADGWRAIMGRDALRSVYAPFFDVLRPVWGVSLGGTEMLVTGDYAYLQAQAAGQRLWVGAYLLRDPGEDRIPIYLGNNRSEIRNSTDSGFQVDEFLGYAWKTPKRGTGTVQSLLQFSDAGSVGRLGRSTRSSAQSVTGYAYGTGHYNSQFGEYDSYSALDALGSGDASGVNTAILVAQASGTVSRWIITHPGLGLVNYDILLRGNGFSKSLAIREVLDEQPGTNEWRKHTASGDYRSQIQTGNRENYPHLPLHLSIVPGTLRLRWLPFEQSPDGRAEEPAVSRFVGNHGALKQQAAIWKDVVHGMNVQPNWNGIAKAHKLTPVFSVPPPTAGQAVPIEYRNGGGIWLRRLFDKAYTWTPGTDTMTDLLWTPATNHSWAVTAAEIEEFDADGVSVGTAASPFTNGFGALVWRATGTHYGVNTDLTVAIYTLVQNGPRVPGTLRISNYTSGVGDVGGYELYDQINGYCLLRCDNDAAPTLGSINMAYSYFMVVGSFAEVQAALNLLYAQRANHIPDSDTSLLV